MGQKHRPDLGRKRRVLRGKKGPLQVKKGGLAKIKIFREGKVLEEKGPPKG